MEDIEDLLVAFEHPTKARLIALANTNKDNVFFIKNSFSF